MLIFEFIDFMKKNVKNNAKKIYTDREVCILLEDVNDKFGFLANGQKTLNNKVDRMEKKLNATFDEVGVLKVGLEIVRTDVETVKDDVKILKDDVKILKENDVVLQKDVAILKQDANHVKDELSAIRNELKAKVGRDEFALLEKRVIDLEKSFRAANLK